MSLFARSGRLVPLLLVIGVLGFSALPAQTLAPVQIATAVRNDSAPKPDPSSSERLDAQITREQLLAVMNQVRSEHGLAPLRLDRRLNLAASDRNHDMARKRYFAHVSPEGVSPFIWIDRHGYRYQAAGENLATGYRSAEATVRAWMNSPSHRENVLGDYRDVGIDVVGSSPVEDIRGETIVAVYGTLSRSRRLQN